MCRIVAHLGEARTLHDVVLAPSHSMLVQSYAPRRQTHGRVNADGWGVAWWPTPGQVPARWRSTRPIWQDAAQSLGSVAPHVTSTCFVASVRDATPGMPLDETATAPFVVGPWALTHNGSMDRDQIPPGPTPPESLCDSAMIATVVLNDPERLGPWVRKLGEADPVARLTMVTSDGSTLLGVTWGEPLWWRRGHHGVSLVSEPTDDSDGWVEVPDRHLVRITGDDIDVTPLEQP